MVTKMKSILFKTVFKNIRYKLKEGLYSNLQPSIALHDLTMILKCPAFLFLQSRNLIFLTSHKNKKLIIKRQRRE